MNSELPDVQAGFRKGRGTSDQFVNIHWIIKKARVPEKHLPLLYWLCQSLRLCGSHKLRKILQKMGILDHLICLLRNLYGGQETSVRTGQATTDCLQIGKGIHQGCILSPCLFNIYAWYIMGMQCWMKHKLESRLPGEILITSDTQMILPLWQKVKKN